MFGVAEFALCVVLPVTGFDLFDWFVFYVCWVLAVRLSLVILVAGVVLGAYFVFCLGSSIEFAGYWCLLLVFFFQFCCCLLLVCVWVLIDLIFGLPFGFVVLASGFLFCLGGFAFTFLI